MKLYGELQTVGADGMTFANKTAHMVCYERDLES